MTKKEKPIKAAAEEFIDYLNSQYNQAIVFYEKFVKSKVDLDSTDEDEMFKFIRRKARIMSFILNGLDLSPEACPFCLNAEGDCDVCAYGKVAGLCSEYGSVYRIVTATQELFDYVLSMYGRPDRAKEATTGLLGFLLAVFYNVISFIKKTANVKIDPVKCAIYEAIACTDCVFGISVNERDIEPCCQDCQLHEENNAGVGKCPNLIKLSGLKEAIENLYNELCKLMDDKKDD